MPELPRSGELLGLREGETAVVLVDAAVGAGAGQDIDIAVAIHIGGRSEPSGARGVTDITVVAMHELRRDEGPIAVSLEDGEREVAIQ